MHGIWQGGDQSSFETSVLRRSAVAEIASDCFPKAVVPGSVNVLGRCFEVDLG